MKLYFVNVNPQNPGWEGAFQDERIVDWIKLLNFPSKTREEEIVKIAQRSYEIEEALQGVRSLFADKEFQDNYEAQWTAKLNGRSMETYLNEIRDAERDADRDPIRDRERDIQVDAKRSEEIDNKSKDKQDYILRRLYSLWKVDPFEVNSILKHKVDFHKFDLLDDISEKICDCENYENFLEALSKIR